MNLNSHLRPLSRVDRHQQVSVALHDGPAETDATESPDTLF